MADLLKILKRDFRILNIIRYLYSLQQKHCTTALDEKSSVFLTVNFYEILHASTCAIYEYIYIVKKPAADSARPPAAAACGQ